jgi:hypothetical protein
MFVVKTEFDANLILTNFQGFGGSGKVSGASSALPSGALP